MRTTYPIDIPLDAIAEFCRRNHIRKLSLFGSILRDDFGPESDVDVLVEFEEGKTPGLAFFTMGEEATVRKLKDVARPRLPALHHYSSHPVPRAQRQEAVPTTRPPRSRSAMHVMHL